MRNASKDAGKTSQTATQPFHVFIVRHVQLGLLVQWIVGSSCFFIPNKTSEPNAPCDFCLQRNHHIPVLARLKKWSNVWAKASRLFGVSAGRNRREAPDASGRSLRETESDHVWITSDWVLCETKARVIETHSEGGAGSADSCRSHRCFVSEEVRWRVFLHRTETNISSTFLNWT